MANGWGPPIGCYSARHCSQIITMLRAYQSEAISLLRSPPWKCFDLLWAGYESARLCKHFLEKLHKYLSLPKIDYRSESKHNQSHQMLAYHGTHMHLSSFVPSFPSIFRSSARYTLQMSQGWLDTLQDFEVQFDLGFPCQGFLSLWMLPNCQTVQYLLEKTTVCFVLLPLYCSGPFSQWLALLQTHHQGSATWTYLNMLNCTKWPLSLKSCVSATQCSHAELRCKPSSFDCAPTLPILDANLQQTQPPGATKSIKKRGRKRQIWDWCRVGVDV